MNKKIPVQRGWCIDASDGRGSCFIWPTFANTKKEAVAGYLRNTSLMSLPSHLKAVKIEVRKVKETTSRGNGDE